jgi:hypothetical protein
LSIVGVDSTPFHDKSFQKTRNRRNAANILKAIYYKCIDDIILSEEKLKPLPLTSGMR